MPDFDAEFFEERAAIREFDGGMSRLDARIAALEDVVAWQASVQARGLTAALPERQRRASNAASAVPTSRKAKDESCQGL